jgi:hypothetical protein
MGTMVEERWCRLGAFGLPFGCSGRKFRQIVLAGA